MDQRAANAPLASIRHVHRACVHRFLREAVIKLETYLPSPVTTRRHRMRPAANHIDAFADWLHLHGYRPFSIKNLLTALAGWTDWVLFAGFTALDLLPAFEACKLAPKDRQRVRRQSLTATSVFIRFLQHQGELPAPAVPPRTSDNWPILGEYRSWMRTHRGLTETTLDVYEGILAGFLDALGDDGHASGLRGCRTLA